MDWNKLRRSGNVRDARGSGRRGASLGLGGILIVVVGSLLFGLNPAQVLSLLQGGAPAGSEAPAAVSDDRTTDFVRAILGDTEDTWTTVFERAGRTYDPPELVLFDGSVATACGTNSSAVGPFYCPPDERVYLDTSFFRELAQLAGTRGEFASAYVIAHEVGHHVQNELGTLERVRAQSARAGEAEANALSVRNELQADCYAGIWAHGTARRGIVDDADIEAAMAAASAIGDDRLQMESQGRVAPDSFTHGSSEQRVRWFRTGLETGSLERCDTFAAGR